jgi:uncharacterized membrane protein YkvA (DUF1232 family)
VQDSLARLKEWAVRLKRNVVALWLAGRDPRTPAAAKLLSLAVAAYALSPIDLIPDFIPILGLLDDLLIVPAGVALAIRMIPAPLMAEFRERADRLGRRPRSVAGAIVVVLVWLGCLAAVGAVLVRRL